MLFNDDDKKYVDEPLSKKIIGFCFDIYNQVGPGKRESHYEKCLELLLKENNINYKRQLSTAVKFNNVVIGRRRLDFLIENRLIVELKVGDYLSKAEFSQVNDYLKEFNKSLGLIILFTMRGVKPRRVVNVNNTEY